MTVRATGGKGSEEDRILYFTETEQLKMELHTNLKTNVPYTFVNVHVHVDQKVCVCQ